MRFLSDQSLERKGELRNSTQGDGKGSQWVGFERDLPCCSDLMGFWHFEARNLIRSEKNVFKMGQILKDDFEKFALAPKLNLWIDFRLEIKLIFEVIFVAKRKHMKLLHNLKVMTSLELHFFIFVCNQELLILMKKIRYLWGNVQ